MHFRERKSKRDVVEFTKFNGNIPWSMQSPPSFIVIRRHSSSLLKPTANSSVAGNLPALRHRNLICAWPHRRRKCNQLGLAAAEIRAAPPRPPLPALPQQVTRRSLKPYASTRKLAGPTLPDVKPHVDVLTVRDDRTRRAMVNGVPVV